MQGGENAGKLEWFILRCLRGFQIDWQTLVIVELHLQQKNKSYVPKLPGGELEDSCENTACLLKMNPTLISYNLWENDWILGNFYPA